MILDLSASRLCYLIAREIEEINPTAFMKGAYFEPTYSDVVKLALLNLYNALYNTADDDLNLIYDPMELSEVENITTYKDDIIQTGRKRQRINTHMDII